MPPPPPRHSLDLPTPLARRQLLVALAEWLCAHRRRDARAGRLVADVHLHILPSMNPDGYESRSRGNARGSDLNRDFPDPIGAALCRHLLLSTVKPGFWWPLLHCGWHRRSVQHRTLRASATRLGSCHGVPCGSSTQHDPGRSAGTVC